MTPKEKAKNLVNIHNTNTYRNWFLNEYVAKKFALIAVNEILNDDWYIATHEDLINRKAYWEAVKKEIEKL